MKIADYPTYTVEYRELKTDNILYKHFIRFNEKDAAVPEKAGIKIFVDGFEYEIQRIVRNVSVRHNTITFIVYLIK